MVELLPKFNDLQPITNPNSTFYECGFNKPFTELEFLAKLQVINDIVRQSIIVEANPDPITETDTLVGDCHTASLASIEYLKALNIGKNHRYVFCRQRPFDPKDIGTRHSAVLVDDEFGNTYLFDATPYVGYKYGSVVNLNQEKVYQDYVEITGNVLEMLNSMREFLYKDSKNMLSKKDCKHYYQVLKKATNYEILNNYSSRCFEKLANYFSDDKIKQTLLKKAISLNPYNHNQDKKEYRNTLRLKQIKIWEAELLELLKTDGNLKKKLELSQNIIQELKIINPDYEVWLEIDGKKERISNITPRFLMEKGLNVIMIKPSAYRIGVRATIREEFLKYSGEIICEYFANLSQETPQTKIKPMLFSHPAGLEYERSMNGTSEVMLLKGRAKDMGEIKKRLRAELGKKIKNKDVIWFDGKPIKWLPHVTNLVHSTDNPSEAGLHLLINYPEHQLMTRFMYPNPNLEKISEKRFEELLIEEKKSLNHEKIEAKNIENNDSGNQL